MDNKNKNHIEKDYYQEATYYEKINMKRIVEGYKYMASINISLCELGFCVDMEELIEYEKRL